MPSFFKAALSLLLASSVLTSSPAGAAERPSRAKFLLEYSDTDGDNALSESEYLAVSEHAAPFAEADLNGDGYISLEELKMALDNG